MAARARCRMPAQARAASSCSRWSACSGVCRADGAPPGLGRAALRSAVGLVADGFPYFLPGLTGLVLALSSKDNQRVGDRAAGTRVVRAEAAGRPIAEVVPPAPAATTPAATALTQQPAGWYADPQGQARLRWWDGSAWTEHVAQ